MVVLWRAEEEGWSSTQLELGEKIVFRQCVFGKEDEFALHCGFTHSKGVKGLREERASSQRSHRVAQRKADVFWNEDEV